MTGDARHNTKLTCEQVVKEWVAFLKASFIYPATNHRVIRSGELVVLGFNQHRNRAGVLRLCLHRDRFRVNQHRVELDKGDSTWLREVCIKTSIAGVDLGPRLSLEVLAEFASRLRRNFQNRDVTDFRLQWTGSSAGVQPLEMHIDGDHLFAKRHDEDETLQSYLGVWGASGGARARDVAKRLGLDPESREMRLLAALESGPELLDGLNRTRERINLEMLSQRSLTGLDILSQLVKVLPPEVLDAPERARACVKEILGVADMRMVALITTGGDDMETDLFNILASIGERIFASTKVGGGQPPASSLPGCPEQETFTEDLQTVLAEHEALPTADGMNIEWQRDLKDEMLGILLHAVVTAQDETFASGLVPELCEVACEAGRAGALLGAYTKGCLPHNAEQTGQVSTRESFWRVAEFVQGHGFASLVGRTDLLTTSTVVAAFPYLFKQFLDSLELNNDVDLGKIRDVCHEIGPERLCEARATLGGADGVLVPSRIEKILARASREVLPLAEMILEEGNQSVVPLAARFLQQLNIRGAESLALRVVFPPSRLPRDYLLALCKAASGRGADRALLHQSTLLVCRFIRDTAEDPRQHERRLHAIRSLRDVDSQDVLILLMDLKAMCGPLTFNKRLRAVRKAASQVLNYQTGRRRN